MNDRLGDLGEDIPSWALEDDDVDRLESGNGANSYGDSNEQSDFNDEEDPWGEKPATQPKYMTTFFNDVDTIKGDIDGIKEATKSVGEINQEAVLATTTDRENELSAQLKPLVDLTNKKAKRVKNLLALLKEENEKLEDQEGVKASDLR